jgi:hypothetical protein
MRGGICPECNRKSVWIDAASPWVLRCDHEGTCGYNETIKERYPELFENWGKRYPSTDDDPKATARAYMGMKRGFESPTIHTWYEQGTHKMENGRAAETVRFELVPGMTWERLIEDEHITQDGGGKTRIKKQNPKATYSGACWMPPGMQIKKGEDVFIVEGIFCAIAMRLAGKKAVAAISSANFPRNLINENKDKNICWCLAYDNEPGAHKHMKRYADELRAEKQRFNAYLIEPGQGDWNDAWLNNTLTDKFIEKSLWRGAYSWPIHPCAEPLPFTAKNALQKKCLNSTKTYMPPSLARKNSVRFQKVRNSATPVVGIFSTGPHHWKVSRIVCLSLSMYSKTN